MSVPCRSSVTIQRRDVTRPSVCLSRSKRFYGQVPTSQVHRSSACPTCFFFHIRTIGPYKSMSSGRTGDDSLRRVLGDLIQVKVCHEILSVLFKDLQCFLLPSKDGCPLRQRGKAIREVCDPEGRREVEKKKASGDDLPCSVGEHHVLLKLAL